MWSAVSIETRSIRSHSRKPNSKNHFHHAFIKVQVQTVHSSPAVSSNPAATSFCTISQKHTWSQSDRLTIRTAARATHSYFRQEHLLFLLTWHPFLPVLLRASRTSLWKPVLQLESMTPGVVVGELTTAPPPMIQVWWFSSPHSFDHRDTIRETDTRPNQ